MDPACSGEQTYERYWYTDINDTDGDGNVTEPCDGTGSQMCRKQFRAGNRFQSYTYDAANRLYRKATTNQPAVITTYNLAGEITRIANPAKNGYAAHSIDYGYDAAGRKTFEEGDDLATRRVSYQYDAAGNRTRTTWPDGYYVQYTYDALNRMDLVLENGSVQLANYDYDTLSRRDFLKLANNANNTVDYVYEADSQLDLLTHRFGAQPTLTLDYGRNHSGQITSLQATDQYYLLGFTNQSSQAYVPNKLNQYDSVNGRDFQYDANGNLTQWYSEAAGWSTYTYDTENRLRTAATQGSATATISYDYDPLGRRISKTVNGTTTHYLLDGNEEIAELSASGSILRRYIMGPAIDDRIAWIEGGATAPAAGNRKYYHVNHQGSVLAVTSADGTPVASYTYDAYGRSSDYQGGYFNQQTGQPYRYTGRRYDVETGLYYYRARYYAPEIGRFLQTDPIGYKDDVNLYAYVKADPVNANDPMGMCETATGSRICGTVSTTLGPTRMSMSSASGAVGDRGGNGQYERTAKSEGSANGAGGLAFVAPGAPVAAPAAAEAGASLVSRVAAAAGPVAATVGAASTLRRDTPESYLLNHYTTREGMAGILADGFIAPSRDGFVYLTPDRYSSGATAQAQLALSRTPVGYLAVTVSSSSVYSAGVVQPFNGQPGGGWEVKINQPVSVQGAQWYEIGP